MRGSTPEERRLWREGVYDQIRGVMSMQGSLSIERMCYLAQVSRAGFYRSLAEQMPVAEEMETRSAIQQIAVDQSPGELFCLLPPLVLFPACIKSPL